MHSVFNIALITPKAIQRDDKTGINPGQGGLLGCSFTFSLEKPPHLSAGDLFILVCSQPLKPLIIPSNYPLLSYTLLCTFPHKAQHQAAGICGKNC